MLAARIGLVHPPLDGFLSGGNVYNEHLLECARRRGRGPVSLPWGPEQALHGQWDLLVWDSLLLDRVTRVAGERIGLLLHYLPSEEAGLSADLRRMLQALEDRALTRADFAVVTGDAVAASVVARRPDRQVFVCEPGVGEVFVRNETRRPGLVPGLLTVAHLLPAKGHVHLLEVLARLRHLQWHWHLVGDGEVSAQTTRQLRDLIAVESLTDRVTFHGALPQASVAALMADSDLMVFPSTYEAYGIVVAEAAAAGLPVLGNRVGAAEKLIAHGVNGFLAPPGDWERFGTYLRELLENAPLRATLRDNLRRTAVRRWDSTLADFHAACETALTVATSMTRKVSYDSRMDILRR